MWDIDNSVATTIMIRPSNDGLHFAFQFDGSFQTLTQRIKLNYEYILTAIVSFSWQNESEFSSA